jgi:hypothetical protein
MNRLNVEKSGKWSDPDMWPFGIMPVEENEIYCNGHNLIIDIDVKVKLITNKQTYSDVYGGNITINEGVTVTSDLESYNEPLLINESPGQITIKGVIKGSSETISTPCIVNTNNSTINIEGIVQGGGAYDACGIVVEDGTINIIGELCYGGSHYSYPIHNKNGAININNNMTIKSPGHYGENRCLQLEEVIV